MGLEMGKQFNIFHAPLLSFFSRVLYIDVAKNWRGYGITYILFLSLMFTTPEIIKFQAQIEEVLDMTAPIIIPQVPTIYIKSGRLSIDKPSPHEIYNTKTNTLFAVIDTNNTYKTPNESKAIIYITDTKIFFKNSPEDYSQLDIKNLEDMTITHSTLYRWVDVFKKVFFYIVFPFFYLFTFLYLISQVLFCSMLMFIFAKKSMPEISFAQIMRMGAIALTPPVILNIIHTILGIEFMYGGLIILIFGMGYLYFGYRAFAEDKA
ncbi:MAG: DUF1189 domain-containing protein [Thermodesulfovibrionales bacterium]|nr:DUF1189 domain-containing protein [Thermodesulfovibrionales bacterium]